MTSEKKVAINPPLFKQLFFLFSVNGGQTVLCQCIAIYDYAATREDELTIHEGKINLRITFDTRPLPHAC